MSYVFKQTVRSFLLDMIERSRRVNCRSSITVVDYCSSKFAAVGFDEALRLELQVIDEMKPSINTIKFIFLNFICVVTMQSKLLSHMSILHQNSYDTWRKDQVHFVLLQI